MPVVFKGGTSGNRMDGVASMPSSGSPQPVLDTSDNFSNPDVHLQAERFRFNMPQTATPDFLPTGGTIPTGSSDVEQQDIAGMGPNTKDGTVWAGAPDTGTKGGPA